MVSIRKDDTYSWTITAADANEEDTVALTIKTVTKKTLVENDEPTLEDIPVNTVTGEWIYITGPAESTDDFTVEFKDYVENGEEIELGNTIVYDIVLKATDSLRGTATYTIALTATAEDHFYIIFFK